MQAALMRIGRGLDFKVVQLSAALSFHRSRAAPHDPGPSPGRFDGRFTPTRSLGAQVLEGRDEVYGDLPRRGRTRGPPLRPGRPNFTSSASRRPDSNHPSATAGRPMVGAMNDWTTAPDIYAAAQLRNPQS